MECLRLTLEIIYYIAFIVLTLLIVKYAKNTYVLQSKKETKLLCKIDIHRSFFKDFNLPFYLEIYNFGNAVSECIDVFIMETKIAKIDFIKPNESYYVPIGDVIRTISSNVVILSYGEKEIEIEENTKIPVKLVVNRKVMQFNLSTNILFSWREGSEVDADKIADAIREVKDAINILNLRG